jgi:hypothetical protein
MAVSGSDKSDNDGTASGDVTSDNGNNYEDSGQR